MNEMTLGKIEFGLAMSDDEFDVLWTNCAWREELDTARNRIPELETEVARLRGFAQNIMDGWPEFGEMDGGDLQSIAVKNGLLQPETRYQSCETDTTTCSCNQYVSVAEWERGAICYRKTELLTGKEI